MNGSSSSSSVCVCVCVCVCVWQSARAGAITADVGRSLTVCRQLKVSERASRSLQVDGERDDDGVEGFVVVDVRDRREGVAGAVPQALAGDLHARHALRRRATYTRRHDVPVSAQTSHRFRLTIVGKLIRKVGKVTGYSSSQHRYGNPRGPWDV